MTLEGSVGAKDKRLYFPGVSAPRGVPVGAVSRLLLSLPVREPLARDEDLHPGGRGR